MDRALHLFGLLAASAVAGALASCSDPVHDTQVSALPPEAAGVPQGEFHRAGQPCTVCHGSEGPAKKQFALAGTVFWQPAAQSKVGVDQAVVSVVDSYGSQIQVTTNCVGNFWITPGTFNPAFPILVTVSKDGTKYQQAMFTQIGRASSCAECHKEPSANYNSTGQIYLTTGAYPVDEVPTTCPVDPVATDNPYGGQF
ncbi:MAG TPA: hypothetical protein VGI39_34370 [Polyangiaceae bacterium]|jgi:cytochrome c553